MNKILMVNDDEEIPRMYKRRFSDQFEFLIAHDMEHAIQLVLDYEKLGIEALFTDVRLPRNEKDYIYALHVLEREKYCRRMAYEYEENRELYEEYLGFANQEQYRYKSLIVGTGAIDMVAECMEVFRTMGKSFFPLPTLYYSNQIEANERLRIEFLHRSGTYTVTSEISPDFLIPKLLRLLNP